MDSWSDAPRYEIVERELFVARAGEFAGSVQRWDEIKETIDMDLARDPYKARPILNTDVYAQPIDCKPPLTIYFTIDEDAKIMILLDIHLRNG